MGQNMKNSPRPATLPPVLRIHSSQDTFRGLLEYFKVLLVAVERELLKVPLSHQVNSADVCFSIHRAVELFVLTEVERLVCVCGGGMTCSDLIVEKRTAKAG